MMKKTGRSMGMLTVMGVFLLLGFLSHGCTDTQTNNVTSRWN